MKKNKNTPHERGPKLGWANGADISARYHLWKAVILLSLIFCLLKTFWTTIFIFAVFVSLAATLGSFLRFYAWLQPVIPEFDPAQDRQTDTPAYTILLPLFHEAHMVQSLMAAMDRLDYPLDKLQILLICEAIDPDTINTVRRNLRAPFELIIVPKGTPQTKPRALNYAMEFAIGEVITIYDAEDRPHPDQLRAAVAKFEDQPELGAVQAPLNYFNARENWLTRQFALEYGSLFHVWLPALASLNMPFPLGGTSNHMRRSALDEVGGWDAHNVTEDADLSFRLAAHGYHIGVISPPTQEEAVANFKDWHFQRARWIKGYMQSWGVHMAAPLAPGGWAGFRRQLTLQVTLGLTLLSIWAYTPVMALVLLSTVFEMQTLIPMEFRPVFFSAFGYAVFVSLLCGQLGAQRAGYRPSIVTVLGMPFYWICLFGPSLRAIWDLWKQPFHWHKTPHGVSRIAENQLPQGQLDAAE